MFLLLFVYFRGGYCFSRSFCLHLQQIKSIMSLDTIKKVVELIISVVLTVAGLVLLGVGLWCPPLGTIDNSVLIAFGEIATFAAAILGIDYHYRSVSERSSRDIEDLINRKIKEHNETDK